ncbi:OB-fold nucleic acid binding domain-containing protein [Actinomyces bowdenii]|uniref:Nucleotide-binding protein n=1 Tax=Actinomyces bowdenii TaxID=131109 RepID=A0A3P1V700_9ACTO|nr:OB-fold nucleic acid binding domain-containing protein [Actinomyces bowdenii]MBO3725202.1 OB-fold nucleic acid binding domain-containing protein [Actinomyces bowdenii]RRD29115.1 nucleotide-binding protein [Actinomyces bowdenii]
MAPPAGALRALLDLLRADREQIGAQDEARSAQRRGTVPICSITPRSRACVSGVLRAITYRPVSHKPVLVAQLFDGTGSVDLVWLGRRSIAGLRPGVHLIVEGMVLAGRSRPSIYNPTYTILGAGQ